MLPGLEGYIFTAIKNYIFMKAYIPFLNVYAILEL